MRSCPTQAIRVRSGKASISEKLCVDCGTCISVCPHGAIASKADPIPNISRFKYNVVVPSPIFYTQFDSRIHPYIIHQAFRKLGFDQVVNVGAASAALTKALTEYLDSNPGRRPLISSHCPSLVRLIQVRYPDLVELIAPLHVPRELTAREIRRTLPAELGLKPEEVGIFLIVPCPAMVVSIKQPAERTKSWFDGVVSIKDMFAVMYPHITAAEEDFDESQVPDDFVFSLGWGSSGSITQAAGAENWLAVSGLQHVMQTFDDIENSRLRNVDFVEALVCLLGCLGGPFTVENPYVARANYLKQKRKYEIETPVDGEDISRKLESGSFYLEKQVLPRPIQFFDTDLETSIKRMKERERVYKKLRKIDCGCCGSPTCLTFAEDFVRGEVELTDCIFLARKGGKVGGEK
jgi:Fe-S-cluster-containing hydrogenase component 2